VAQRRLKKEGTRLDQRVLELGLAASRTRAQAIILAGAVTVNGQVVRKAGTLVSAQAVVEAMVHAHPYVSRGGLKLEHGLRAFAIEPGGWTVVDVGASTGGFTDCWLQHGAEAVYAVDVGYGQLAWSLRQDARVHVLERTNARYLTLSALNLTQPVQASSIDASFIGLKLLLAPLRDIVRPSGVAIGLIKPQFEAGPEFVGKGGVVRDAKVHRRVIAQVFEDADRLGWIAQDLTPSPIRGPSGNIEFLVRFGSEPGNPIHIDAVIEEAWQREVLPDV